MAIVTSAKAPAASDAILAEINKLKSAAKDLMLQRLRFVVSCLSSFIYLEAPVWKTQTRSLRFKTVHEVARYHRSGCSCAHFPFWSADLVDLSLQFVAERSEKKWIDEMNRKKKKKSIYIYSVSCHLYCIPGVFTGPLSHTFISVPSAQQYVGCFTLFIF